jgi:hypothetical protein
MLECLAAGTDFADRAPILESPFSILLAAECSGALAGADFSATSCVAYSRE